MFRSHQQTWLSVRSYAAEWLTRHKLGVRPQTAAQYGFALQRYILPVMGERPLNAIDPSDVHRMQTDLSRRGLSDNTRRFAETVLILIIRDAFDAGLIPRNSLAHIRRTQRRQQHRTVIYDERQLHLFLSMAALMSKRAALFFALGRGALRVGEALALRSDDVDVGRQLLRIERTALTSGAIQNDTKGAKRRFVQMSTQLTRALETAAGAVPRDSWLFPSHDGTPWNHTTVLLEMRRIATVAKLPPGGTPRSLRHSCASLWLFKGAPVHWCQAQLGHARIETTMGYCGHFTIPRHVVLEET